MKNRNKTLENLERDVWDEPDSSSHLITECHRLRKIPLSQFTAENLRIMIGQDIGLKYLVPIALEKLTEDPFVAGDFYAGDLLKAVVQVKWEFWEKNDDLFITLENIMGELESRMALVQKELLPAWQSYFK